MPDFDPKHKIIKLAGLGVPHWGSFTIVFLSYLTIGNVQKYLLFLCNDTPSCRSELDTLELESGMIGKVTRETIRPTIEAFLVYCFEKNHF